jgi:hypothetical protein
MLLRCPYPLPLLIHFYERSSTNGTCIQSAETQLKYKLSIRLYHQQNVKYVEQFLSAICWLLDIQFQPSKKHKIHLQYSLQDVNRIDPDLAVVIKSDAASYGYNISRI